MQTLHVRLHPCGYCHRSGLHVWLAKQTHAVKLSITLHLFCNAIHSLYYFLLPYTSTSFYCELFWPCLHLANFPNQKNKIEKKGNASMQLTYCGWPGEKHSKQEEQEGHCPFHVNGCSIAVWISSRSHSLTEMKQCFSPTEQQFWVNNTQGANHSLFIARPSATGACDVYKATQYSDYNRRQYSWQPQHSSECPSF